MTSQPNPTVKKHVIPLYQLVLKFFPMSQAISEPLANWLVLSDEQMSKRWPFSLLNDEQMSNWLGVKHLPANICHSLQNKNLKPPGQGNVFFSHLKVNWRVQ